MYLRQLFNAQCASVKQLGFSGFNVFFGFYLLANPITIAEGYNFMRMGLACYILRQFLAVRRLSIAIADGPMQHIKASNSGPDVAIRLAQRGVL